MNRRNILGLPAIVGLGLPAGLVTPFSDFS
jgi:hypothetical protein